MKNILFILFLYFLGVNIYSHQIYRNFDELLDEADYIFIGHVLEGRIVDNLPAEYSIRIIEPIKNGEINEIILNHGFYGLRIGYNYLFLLIYKEDNIFTDFFEGMNKFEIIYTLFNGELNYCIRIYSGMIGMNNTVNGEIFDNEESLFNNYIYRIEDIIAYIRKRYE